jgi:hypothetical protein
MIARNRLPEDAATWTSVVIDFPRLENDKAESCPLSEDHIFGYVQVEAADLDEADRTRFRFLRSALVKDQRFWLWQYQESDGAFAYVWVQAGAKGETFLGLNDANGLSPEQFVLAAYYNEIYWS